MRPVLEIADEFGKKSKGWNYVIDTRKVKMIHPCNVFELRKIPKLPNIKEHYVLTNNPLVKFLGKTFLSKALPAKIIKSLDSIEG